MRFSSSHATLLGIRAVHVHVADTVRRNAACSQGICNTALSREQLEGMFFEMVAPHWRSHQNRPIGSRSPILGFAINRSYDLFRLLCPFQTPRCRCR
jgi:hypothetical protein